MPRFPRRGGSRELRDGSREGMTRSSLRERTSSTIATRPGRLSAQTMGDRGAGDARSAGGRAGPAQLVERSGNPDDVVQRPRAAADEDDEELAGDTGLTRGVGDRGPG